MIQITINNVHYKLSMDKLNILMDWLNKNGAIKVIENNNPDSNGRTLINE